MKQTIPHSHGYISEVEAYLSLYGNLHTISGDAEEMFVNYGVRHRINPKCIASIITAKNRGASLQDQAGNWIDGIKLARHLKRLTTLCNNRLLDKLYAGAT